MPWIVNVTPQEFREFKRVQRLNRHQKGLLGDWCIRELGKAAFTKIMLHDAQMVVRKAARVGGLAVPRVTQISTEELARIQAESDAAYGDTDGQNQSGGSRLRESDHEGGPGDSLHGDPR